MHYLDTAYQGAQDYWKEVPQNTGKEMLYSFAGAFIIETIFTGKPSQGLMTAGISALAVGIYGLVSPLFKSMLGRTDLSWGEEMCRTFTAVIGAGCVAAALGNSSILGKLVGEAIYFGVVIYLMPSRKDLTQANWIVIFPTYVPSPV